MQDRNSGPKQSNKSVSILLSSSHTFYDAPFKNSGSLYTGSYSFALGWVFFDLNTVFYYALAQVD